MKAIKLFGAIGALIVAALVGGTLIGSVAAESPSSSGSPSTATSDDGDVGQYCQTFRGHLADELGTDQDGLEAAIRSAAEATLDEAVANGDLTKKRADELKSRLADANLDRCLGFPRTLAAHPGRVAYHVDLGAAAADALGMQPSALAAKLRSGTSLQDIAEAQGLDYDTVKEAVLDAARTDLDKAVDAGKLTSDQEQTMLDRLSDNLDAGAWPPHPGRGPGLPGPRGPWHPVPGGNSNGNSGGASGSGSDL